MYLAVAQARVIFSTLAQLHPTAALISRPDYRRTVTIRGIDHMVVTFD